jgi:hypothetical protein
MEGTQANRGSAVVSISQTLLGQAVPHLRTLAVILGSV